MSRVFSFAIASMLVVGFTQVAVAQFPYEGIVSVESGSLHVRSGPSENYYRTGRLERDDRVTVVGEKPDGWLAIAPPDGSFSWIRGDYVREVGESEIEVTGNNVIVRVGTPFDDRQRDSSQVKLNRGARLHVLDRRTEGQGQLTNLWYKITPPTGEVRYVMGKYVRPADGRRSIARPEVRMNDSKRRPATPELDDDRQAATETQRPRDVRDRTESSNEAESAGESGARRERPAPTRQFDDTPRGRLDRAQAAYRDMMKEPLPDRDIESVRTLFEQAATATQTETDHLIIVQRLEDLESQAERQARFAELDRLLRKSKQRDEALLSMGKMKASSDNTLAESDAEQQPPVQSGFDASGVLRKSSVTIEGKPAFILAGPYGGIRYYVTGAPGVDLRKYLDQTVAVRGPVRYREEIRNQHILVRDVTPVEVKR